MPMVRMALKLNKINGFFRILLLRHKQNGNFWHSCSASGEIFWRDWHNKKAPNHFGLGLGGKKIQSVERVTGAA
jgi:hypothetical protein